VTLLDWDGAIAQAGVDRQVMSRRVSRPDPRKGDPQRLLTQNISLLGEIDWIIEVASEHLAAMYDTVAAVRKRRVIVSSNTFTIPLSRLCSALTFLRVTQHQRIA
jgi:3-hydroxyacyl-CoA dehydrogenase